ncbi:MAG: YfhO family protein [Ignavibacteriota bacterium]
MNSKLLLILGGLGVSAFAFLSIVFWAAVIYLNKKISVDILMLVIIILTVADLWRIDARGAKYHDAPEIKNQFEAPQYVTVIKSQNDKDPFRMLNLKQDKSLGSFSQNSNFNAYFLLEDFYGYSGIKPRAYQDIMDVVGPANPTLWRMLGVKYLVLDQPVQMGGITLLSGSEKTFVYRNDASLPRAYFVNKVEKKSGADVLNLIKENAFDPKEIAFVQDKDLKVDTLDSTASSKIIKYTDEKLQLDVNASGNNFMFFGSTYLPTGWKAFVDKKQTEILKTNHGFMGIVVPKGKHKVEFHYAPTSFYISKYIVLILSSLSILGIILGIFFERRNQKKVN